jgi:DNA-binding NtrC family response regulator
MYRPVHVLLAEDESHTRLALALILKKAGYRVTLVEDGQQALDWLSEVSALSDPVDLLIIDIQMPKLTGIVLLHELDKRNISIPTLIISGYRYREIMESSHTKAELAYLEKPFEPHEFLWNVERLLEASSIKRSQSKQQTKGKTP